MARLLGAIFGLNRGNLLDAEADAWEALGIVRSTAAVAVPIAVAVAIEVLIERGELDRAEQLAAEEVPRS